MTDAPTEIARRRTFAIISHPDAGARSPLLHSAVMVIDGVLFRPHRPLVLGLDGAPVC